MPDNAPHNALRYHVTGAIERGESEPITAREDRTTMTDTRVELYMAGARQMGREAAQAAASWAADGNTTDYHRRNMLRMLDDGDPKAWDFLPTMPNLSGEFADSPTPDSLFEDVVGENDTDMDADDLLDAICEAYEEGVSEVFEDACRAELASCL